GGDMQWMNSVSGGNEIGGELLPRIGALLVGHNTWSGDDPNRGTEEEGAFGGAWSGPQFVLAHQAPAEQPPDVTFLDDLERAIALSREAAGTGYVCILGADV